MKRRYFLTAILLVLLLALLAACGVLVEPETAAPSEPQVEAVQPEEEPATLKEVASDSTFYAANPELMVAERYVAAPAEPALATESTFYAANPELMAANRASSLLVIVEPASESTFYAANPELMAASRFAAPAEPELVIESTFLAANPELMVAQRYAVLAALSEDQESVEPGFQFIRLH